MEIVYQVYGDYQGLLSKCVLNVLKSAMSAVEAYGRHADGTSFGDKCDVAVQGEEIVIKLRASAVAPETEVSKLNHGKFICNCGKEVYFGEFRVIPLVN